MKIALVTTFNKRLYDYYAHRFIETYNWPFDLYVYHAGWHPPKEGIFFRDINKYNPELQEFIEQMNTNQFKQVQKFFDTMPKLKHEVKVKNPKTKKMNTITLAGLNDFFA